MHIITEQSCTSEMAQVVIVVLVKRTANENRARSIGPRRCWIDSCLSNCRVPSTVATSVSSNREFIQYPLRRFIDSMNDRLVVLAAWIVIRQNIALAIDPHIPAGTRHGVIPINQDIWISSCHTKRSNRCEDRRNEQRMCDSGIPKYSYAPNIKRKNDTPHPC